MTEAPSLAKARAMALPMPDCKIQVSGFQPSKPFKSLTTNDIFERSSEMKNLTVSE